MAQQSASSGSSCLLGTQLGRLGGAGCNPEPDLRLPPPSERPPGHGWGPPVAAGRASQCDLGGCPYPSRPARSPTRCGNPGLDGVHSHGSGPLGQWSRPAWGPSSPRRSLPDPGADQQEDGLQVAAVHCGPGRTPPGGEGPGTCPGSEWACSVRCVPELGDPRLLEGQARRAAPPCTTANRKANYFAERAF